MSRYLLDTGILTAYLRGRQGAVKLVEPWAQAGEAVTSIVVYGEVIEYLKSFTDPDYRRHYSLLHGMLQSTIYPFSLSFAIMERYADMRRAMHPPHGSGLIGDIDTLVAATALEHGLEIITTDSDYTRVPSLSVQIIARAALR